MNPNITHWFSENEERLRLLALDIFRHPETAGEEQESALFLMDFMKAQGFTVKTGEGKLATAFRAQWGSGKPVIAFLAEYDALPELGQEPVPERSPVDGNGHGCGHNLLGAGCAGAAAAMKAALEAQGLPGTVVLFGCPAEETCQGKVWMAREGWFDGVDLAVSWHPSDKNQVSEESFQALVSRKFRFYGKTAHAAASPEQGRSALDAAELTNVAVNYLREHVPDHVRMHYVYTSAGDKPNIVPGFAELWYFIRARDKETVADADHRVWLAAYGASIATQTRVETEELTQSPDTKILRSLTKAMHEVLSELGGPAFTGEELAFAETLRTSLGLPEMGPALNTTVEPYKGTTVHMTGSTDVSAVSQTVPTVTLNIACQVAGAPGHHWGITACAGSGVGLRGMVHGAKVMAQFGVRCVTQQRILTEAWEEFREG